MTTSKTFASHLLLAAALCAGATAQAADWSDNAVGYYYGPRFREPGISSDIAKHVFEFSHASGYQYGNNFVNVQALFSDRHDPASNGGGGAQELYFIYRHQLEAGKVTGNKWSFGPVRDVALSAGFDLNSKDTTFGPRKRMLVIGPTLKFDVPGFFDLGLRYRTERNHNGIPSAQQHDVRFDDTYMLESAWGIPFQLGPVPLKFKGFASYVPKKGKDGFGKDTAGETMLHATLLVDLGKLAFDKKDTFYAGVGYEYWRNKFGNQPGPGTKASTPYLNLEWHL
jgi:nucleoside-specific outer membrane channel protein Tsx